MTITIKYFGQIAEVTNCHSETYEFSGRFISELLNELHSKYPSLKGKDFKVAQNNELAPFTAEVTTNEIALLPPFSGG